MPHEETDGQNRFTAATVQVLRQIDLDADITVIISETTGVHDLRIDLGVGSALAEMGVPRLRWSRRFIDPKLSEALIRPESTEFVFPRSAEFTNRDAAVALAALTGRDLLAVGSALAQRGNVEAASVADQRVSLIVRRLARLSEAEGAQAESYGRRATRSAAQLNAMQEQARSGVLSVDISRGLTDLAESLKRRLSER